MIFDKKGNYEEVSFFAGHRWFELFACGFGFIASIVVGLSSKSQGNMGYLFLFGGIFLSFSIVVYAQLLEVFVDIARNTGEAVNLLKNKQQ